MKWKIQSFSLYCSITSSEVNLLPLSVVLRLNDVE